MRTLIRAEKEEIPLANEIEIVFFCMLQDC